MKNNSTLLLFFLICFFKWVVFCSCNSHNEADSKLCHDTIFVSDLWKKSKLDRGRMIDDLIKNNKLLSLSRDSVLNLLGAPSEDSNSFINYLFDMNCDKKKYGLMLFHIEIDSLSNKVTDCYLTD